MDSIPKSKQQEEQTNNPGSVAPFLPEIIKKDDKPKSVLTEEDQRGINLAVHTEKTSVLNPVEYNQIKKLAQDFHSSGAISGAFQNVNQIVMAIMSGREMGMSTTESLNGLYFVGGKLNIYGKATPAQIRRHGWKIQYKDETPDSVTAVVTNAKTGEEIEETYTYQEANLSGFTKDASGRDKVGWKPGANRRRKLRYGVLSLIIHTYIPEVIGAAVGVGEYSQDYMDADRLHVENSDDDKKAEMKDNIKKAQAKKQELDDTKFNPEPVSSNE